MVSPSRGWQGNATIVNTTPAAVKAAAGAATRNYITRAQIQNKHATVATVVQILSGAVVIFTMNCPAVQTAPVQLAFDPPLQGDINTAINVNNVTTGSDVMFNLQGFSGI